MMGQQAKVLKVITTVYHMFKKLSRNMEDIKKDPKQISKDEN